MRIRLCKKATSNWLRCATLKGLGLNEQMMITCAFRQANNAQQQILEAIQAEIERAQEAQKELLKQRAQVSLSSCSVIVVGDNRNADVDV